MYLYCNKMKIKNHALFFSALLMLSHSNAQNFNDNKCPVLNRGHVVKLCGKVLSNIFGKRSHGVEINGITLKNDLGSCDDNTALRKWSSLITEGDNTYNGDLEFLHGKPVCRYQIHKGGTADIKSEYLRFSAIGIDLSSYSGLADENLPQDNINNMNRAKKIEGFSYNWGGKGEINVSPVDNNTAGIQPVMPSYQSSKPLAQRPPSEMPPLPQGRFNQDLEFMSKLAKRQNLNGENQ